VTICCRNASPSASYRRKSSWHATTRLSFISCVSRLGSHLAHTFRNFSSSWMMWWANPILMSNSNATSLTVMRRCSRITFSTAAILSSVTAVNAGPGRGESPTPVTPFLNFSVYSHTSARLVHLSPYWILIRQWISIGFTPSLNKNLTTLRCSCLVHRCKGTAILSNCLPGSYAWRRRANAIYW